MSLAGRAAAFEQLVEGRVELAQARDVGDVVGLLVDLVEVDHEHRRLALHAVHLVERIAVLEEGQARLGELGLLLPQVPRQLRLGVECVVVEFTFHFPGRRLQPCHLLADRSEEHTSELKSLMRISYAVFCLKKKNYETTLKRRTLTTSHFVQSTNVKLDEILKLYIIKR